MTVPIEILPLDAHPNVAATTAAQSYTPTLGGYGGGSIPLAAQLKSEPIDCSEYSLLRLALELSSITSRHGQGDPGGATRLWVTLEHSADAGRTWQVLHAFAPAGPLPSVQHVSLSGFHALVRASWYFGDAASFARTITDEVAVTWGLSGHAVAAVEPEE